MKKISKLVDGRPNRFNEMFDLLKDVESTTVFGLKVAFL